MRNKVIVGARAPEVKLGYLQHGAVMEITTDELFTGKNIVVLGIPGAFTPVCTKQHLPDFVANADKLYAAGFDELVCIAPNDPFVLDAWQGKVDPDSRIRFLSDGNLEFCSALDLSMVETKLFLGRRSQRFMLVVRDRIIHRARAERSILEFKCTRAEDALRPDESEDPRPMVDVTRWVA